MRRALQTLLILGIIGVLWGELFLHRIKFWRWNNMICEACKRDYHPVCGIDGKTYRNGCTLMCSARKRNSPLGILYGGECKTHRYRQRSLYREGCPHCIHHPESVICGSNGLTFYNLCYFDCYREEDEADGDLKIIHTGPCLADDLTAPRSFRDEVECICSSKTGKGWFLRENNIGKRLMIRAGRNVYNKCEEEDMTKPSENPRFGYNFTFPAGKTYAGFCEDRTWAGYGDMRQIRRYNPCKCPPVDDNVCVRYPNSNVTQLRKNICYSQCERETTVDVEECHPKESNCASFDPHCVTKLFRHLCHFECFRSVKDPRMTYQEAVRRTIKKSHPLNRK